MTIVKHKKGQMNAHRGVSAILVSVLRARGVGWSRHCHVVVALVNERSGRDEDL